MLVDIKLHKRIADKNIVDQDIDSATKVISVCWEDPSLVIKQEEGYIASHIEYHNIRVDRYENQRVSYIKKVFDFNLVTPYYSLYQRNACKLSVLIPNSERVGTYKLVYTKNAIFQLQELKDIVFIFYFDRQPTKTMQFIHLDAYIFHGGILKYKIIDIIGEIDTKNGFEIDKIHFARSNRKSEREYPDNWILLNGKESSEDDLDLSFIQWEKLFGYHRNSYYQLSNMYDRNNRVDVNSEQLRWNSKELMNWKCIFGHRWKKSIYDYTHPKWPKQFCQVCQEKIKGLGFFDCNEIIIRNIEKIIYVMKYYKTDDLDDLLHFINVDLVNLESMILHRDQDSPWINKQNLPKTVIFYFAYPDGKRGDISRAIANNGIVIEMEYNEYKCLISTEYYKEIEVLASYHCNAKFRKNDSEIVPSFWENYKLFDRMVFESEISSFMFENHLIYKYLVLCDIKYIYRSALLHRCPSKADDYISARIAPLVDNYRKRIKSLSEELRNKAVEQNISSSKWSSEQKLYRIVKKKYTDAIFQYQDIWLGSQSLDIYIPSIRVGIEYQGKQHYLPVDIFGGEEGLIDQQKRDERKRELCLLNEVELIEWRYDYQLSEGKVYEKIEAAKQKRP